MTVGQRIKARREECGLSVIELAERLGKARSTVYRYEGDEIQDMPITVLEPLAEALNTTPAYLMGWSDNPLDYSSMDFSDIDPEIARHLDNDPKRMYDYRKALDADQRRTSLEMSLPSNVRPISTLHHQSIPLIGSAAAGEPIYDPEELGVYVDSPVECDAAITIRGDSMTPTYQDGDVVYIKCRPDVPEGAVAVVFLDNEATIKHIYKRPTGLTLVSDNMEAYPPIMAEFADYPNMRIFGAPVGYTRIYKSSIAGKVRKGSKQDDRK